MIFIQGGVFSLLKNVIINRDSTINIDIAALEKFEKKENLDILAEHNCKVHYVGCTGNKILKQLKIYKNLKSLIETETYDCIHIHADVSNKLLISGLAAKRAGARKIILHSHASGVDGKYRKMKLLIHKVCRCFLKYIGTDFVACSDLAAFWMFKNISLNHITIINNGVDLEKFRFNVEMRYEMRKKLNIRDNELVIGHVGRFAYQKNHEYLVTLFSALKLIRPDAKLLLIGEGPYKNYIDQMVCKEHLQNSVIFYGTSNQVYNLFQAMDIFVLPSHFEGLPIVGVEAQAAGLPVIFSDQITREAKLIEAVEYLPITSESIGDWIETIEKFSSYKRKDTYNELKAKKFDIQDTIISFLKLYQ